QPTPLTPHGIMQHNPRPRLRRHVLKVRDPRDPHYGYLLDGLRQNPRPVRLPLLEFGWLEHFDGRKTLPGIQAEARNGGGATLPLERFADLARRLDDALLLAGARWDQHVGRSVREPVCIGCYDADPDVLTRQVADLFTGRGGPGMPRSPRPEGRLRAALVPHIDYARGGAGYAWGFKEGFEGTDATLFVIIGTSHHSAHRFTLTRKAFKTPLGILPTDQDHIDRVVRHYGEGLFDDELQAHLPEHSIELEVVLLQWYYTRRRLV